MGVEGGWLYYEPMLEPMLKLGAWAKYTLHRRVPVLASQKG